MKCLNCQAKGRHFYRKICSTCTSSGVSRDDIKITKHKTNLVGASLSDLVSDVVNELKDRFANYSHFRGVFKQHPYDNTKNKITLTWSEYERSGESNGNR